MRPLYVDGVDAAVRLDGPALRVIVPSCADRWFPLCRLSQIVSSCRVDWEVPALLACAREGVSVSFLDTDGALIARCIGRMDVPDTLQQKLERFFLRDDCQALYAQWLAAMENMAARSVLRRSGLSWDQAPNGRMLRSLFREGALAMNAPAAYERVGREVHSLLLALMTQWLMDSRVDVARFNGAEVNLAADLADLLFWDFQLARLRWLEQRLEAEQTVEPPSRVEIVRFFEARRERTEKLLRGLIRRLNRWLMELE